ncbi:PREDICTED: leucine-rich repeat-containing protein 24-like [Priapulus caudatus]|uniref:Leucine-rich repeat-containing protein 24-like n=1 Tax=Priapulus caudatus TaxID=37621 RepID=A0ABM1ECH5_PRICU|nr:PREDICTED: leucine-rich repeat-containing protein 24-like [Priapulus caudatus]
MGQYSIVGLPLVLLLVTFCMRRSAACVESCQCNQTGTRWTCVGDGSDDPPVFSNNITIIRFLEISQYNISALRRDHVGDNPRLVRLLLNGNEIRSIEPGAFAGTSHLLWLSLNENSLREVDAHSFADLTMLKHLTLEGNEIETIGDSTFQSLGELRRLDMSRNRIREITGRDLRPRPMHP